jgi:hypothetical protein
MKSFSIANTFPNMINKQLKYFELIDMGTDEVPDWKGAIFTVDITDAPNYLNNDDLSTYLGGKLNGHISRQRFSDEGGLFESENSRLVDDAQDESSQIAVPYLDLSYKFQLLVSTNNNDRQHIFGLCRDDDISEESLWKNMGFEGVRILTIASVEINLSQLRDGLIVPEDFDQQGINAFTNRIDIIPYQPSSQIAVHENHLREINVCSNTLATDSCVTFANGHCVPTNILETVVNDVAKFSYLHHNANKLYFHKLNNKGVSRFDIQLLDTNYNVIEGITCADWKAVLIFEELEEIEYHAEDIERYNAEGYRRAHRY